MQIHELSRKRPVNEGLLDLAKKAASGIGNIGNPAAQAASAAAGLQRQGYGAQYQGASARWQDKLAELDRDPAVAQYVRGVAQAWMAQRKLKEAAEIQPAPNAGAPTPAEQAQLQQRIQAALAQQTPAPTAPAQDPYKQTFISWADSQLLTRDPTSNKTITMDAVRQQYPDLAQRLAITATQVAERKGTAQELEAVSDYIKLATAGVRAAAQAQRNLDAQRGAGTVASHAGRLNATTDQMAELTRLAQKMGGVDKLINYVKRISGS